MNVGLDLVGQARNWLEYAAELQGEGRDADHLAYRRDERAYRNLLLVEQPNGDFAVTMTKQFLYDAWHFAVLQGLVESSDARIESCRLTLVTHPRSACMALVSDSATGR